MRNSKVKPFVMVLATVVMLLSGCNQKTVYNRYVHTPLDGWEKNDTLFFDIRPIGKGGQYLEELGLRLDRRFPFTSLQLTVEQVLLPMGHVRYDTLTCNLFTKGGQPMGDGISYYQCAVPISRVMLNKGDSLHICVRHNMKREMLIGIADIGIKLTKE